MTIEERIARLERMMVLFLRSYIRSGGWTKGLKKDGYIRTLKDWEGNTIITADEMRETLGKEIA